MAASTLERGSPGTLLVVGGGIAGLTTAIEAAEVGHDVILVERRPYLGGRVSQLHHYFPKLCPPTCGLEINFRRLRTNDRIRVLTLSEVESIEGGPGAYKVRIKERPRYVNERCTACGDCEKAVTVEVDDEYNYGLKKRKAAYLPYPMAYPYRYVIDGEAAGPEGLKACAEACPYGAVEPEQQEQVHELTVGSIVYATGWRPYDAAKLGLGYGESPDVITNVQMERLAATEGPTGGKILRPSDGQEIKSVAFVQCAGSRDENHLPYCSAVCCLASLKQAEYVREAAPEADIHVFYIDIRSPGRLEDFFEKVKNEPKVHLHRGKVAKVVPTGGKLAIEAEDTLTGKLSRAEVDLVVLATGMVPQTDGLPAGAPVSLDDFGFVGPDGSIVGAGTVTQPLEVSAAIQDATGAALRAIVQLGKE